VGAARVHTSVKSELTSLHSFLKLQSEVLDHGCDSGNDNDEKLVDEKVENP